MSFISPSQESSQKFMFLKKNPSFYRHVAIASIGLMIIVLYALVLSGASHKLLSSSEGFISQKKISEKNSLKPLTKTGSFLKHFGKPNQRSLTQVCANSFSELLKFFDTCGFDLQRVRCGEAFVPRLTLMELPKDMGKTKNIKARKKAFIQSLLPMILHINEKIMEKREKLLRLEKKTSLTSPEKQWLKELAVQYKVKTSSLRELKKRVDIVPPSLFLAQAIMETGWGTSSAARFKKSLFGVTLKSGVKSYETLQESIDAYIHNLNYNSAYQGMRDLRFQMRVTKKELCSHKLIGKLLKYCERRMWYVHKVRKTISKNNLKQFDRSRLEEISA